MFVPAGCSTCVSAIDCVKSMTASATRAVEHRFGAGVDDLIDQAVRLMRFVGESEAPVGRQHTGFDDRLEARVLGFRVHARAPQPDFQHQVGTWIRTRGLDIHPQEGFGFPGHAISSSSSGCRPSAASASSLVFPWLSRSARRQLVSSGPTSMAISAVRCRRSSTCRHRHVC